MPEQWKMVNNKITKEFTFNDFAEALAFVNNIGDVAERLQHHPDLFLHDYKKVTVTTSTHDAGNVTEKDYELASAIDKLLA